ncbi:MAG: NifU family protein [Alphaproteobacteria bacterium]
MFIQTEDTPNPDTLKFLPGQDVSPAGPVDLRSEAEAEASPLAQRLFRIKGVNGVFYGSDFIAVSKSGVEWQHIKPAVLGAIMEHFTSGAPLLADGAAPQGGDHGAYEGEDAEVVEQIIELLNTRVRPAVANDGGDITFKRWDARSGTVFLHMRGSCQGCPSSTATLKSGIERLLKHYVPEVVSVEAA